jgi:hypothetical protein
LLDEVVGAMCDAVERGRREEPPLAAYQQVTA